MDKLRFPILFACIILNYLIYQTIAQFNAISISGLSELFKEIKASYPAAISSVFVLVLNAQISPENKARIVFLRWKNALPGHRAFSEHANSDPRVDVNSLKRLLGDLPEDQTEQNKVWYGLYRSVQSHEKIKASNMRFVITRDLTCLTFFFLLFLPISAFITMPTTQAAGLYTIVLILQLGLCRQAAKTYGDSLVRDVLSETNEMDKLHD